MGMNFKCQWCEGEKDGLADGGGIEYCSAECERAALYHAMRVLDGQTEASDIPDKWDTMDLRQRAKRWTPERMQERIRELRPALR
jgi:hypothetical protein